MNSRVLPLGLMLAGAVSASAIAQEVDVKVQGATVQVGPDRGAGGVKVLAPGVNVDVRADKNGAAAGRSILIGPDGVAHDASERLDAQQAGPSYWVGIRGGEVSPELRMHLDLKDAGVIVQEVVPESPAAKAGLKQHDILLRANGESITAMRDLVELVAEVGPTKGQVTLELIRAGQPHTLWVTPEERTIDQAAVQPGFREPNAGGEFNRMLGGLFDGQAEGGPFQFRMFGPGVVVQGPNVQANVAGTSVSVSTVNGQTRVKVNRNGEEWDIDATDPKALEQLPEDIRVLVDGVMAGGGQGVNVNVNEMIPNVEGLLGGNLRDRFQLRREMQREMQEMRRQIQELRRQLDGGAPPAAGGGQAPQFEPNPPIPPRPVEIEIPAEQESE